MTEKAAPTEVSQNISILKVVDKGYLAAKTWHRDETGSQQCANFNPGWRFWLEQRHLKGIRSLASLLAELEPDPERMVIRGEPIAAIDRSKPVRCLKNTKGQYKATFFETPRSWMCLDIDKCLNPDGLDPATDFDKASAYLLSQLPAELQGATCYFQWTSSQNMSKTNTLSAHVWFWLEQPLGENKLKAWCANVNEKAGMPLLDMKMFQTIQNHATAFPQFVKIHGLSDPLPVRSKLIEGTKDAVKLPKIKASQVSKAGKKQKGSKFPLPKSFNFHLSTLGDGPGKEGFYSPLLKATWSFVWLNGEPDDRNQLIEEIRNAIDDAPKGPERDQATVERYKSDQFLNNLLDGAIEKNRLDRKVYPNDFCLPDGSKPPVTKMQNRYLSGIDLQTGVTFIKSPKNTGKTHYLLETEVAKASPTNRVLIITHRRSLATNLSDRCELLDYQEANHHDLQRVNGLTICADSLHKLEGYTTFDTVILDESEQVIRHFKAKTMDRRTYNYDQLCRLISQATRVICLDADLSNLTVDQVMMSRAEGEVPQIVVNEYKVNTGSTVNIFGTMEEVWQAVEGVLRHGGKCYFATNSKTQAKLLHKHLEKTFPELKGICVTAENSAETACREIIRDPNTECIKYDWVLASPSIVSGISIDVEYFTHVFGIFFASSTTHMDALQSISRVRKIDEINVWLDPRTFTLETDPKQVGNEWLRAFLEKERLVGITVEGRRYSLHPKFERLTHQIVALENTSRCNFASNFITDARAEGYKIEVVDRDEEAVDAGKEDRAVAKAGLVEERTNGIMEAVDISEEEQLELEAKLDQQNITKEEFYELEKRRLREFYGDVSEKIIAEDDDGRFRNASRNFDFVATNPERIKLSDTPPYLDPNKYRHQIHGNILLNHFGRLLLGKCGVTFGADGEPIFDGSSFDGAKLKADQEFTDDILHRQAAFKEAFRLKVNVDDFASNPVKYVNMALQRIGLKCYVVSRVGNVRTYQINQEQLERLNQLRKIHKKTQRLFRLGSVLKSGSSMNIMDLLHRIVMTNEGRSEEAAAGVVVGGDADHNEKVLEAAA